ncbi:MAG: HAD hydrolase-like protein [Candidatus Methanomethylophilaceae archaeon]|nr:HAD hydrolase-like protein [Candidatus Methanomethylophilaceae archaeon]
MPLDPKYRAICFDMDGTLLLTKVDYVKMSNLVFDVFEELGVPESAINRNNGYKFNIEGGCKWLIDNGRSADLYTIQGRISNLARDVEMEFVDEAKPVPGISEILFKLREMGYKIGVLTRGCREYAETALKVCEVYSLLDGIVARDDYPEEEAKPAPIAMKHMADDLGVRPEEILFFGDHTFDYNCAVDSGAGFIGVLTGTLDREDWFRLDENMTVFEDVSELGRML